MPENDPRQEVAAKRAQYLREHADAVLEVKERAQWVFGELILQEMDYLVDSGFTKEQAYLPAVNNLGMRKLAIQGELLAELARLQGVMRRKLERLAEDEEDASPNA